MIHSVFSAWKSENVVTNQHAKLIEQTRIFLALLDYC